MNKKGVLIALFALIAIFALERQLGGRGHGGGGHGGGGHGGGGHGGGGHWGGHRGGGWGRRGSGLGFGLGIGYGLGYGYPYYAGSYWDDYDYPVYSAPVRYEKYADSDGKKYWEVLNDTPYSIEFTAEGNDPRTIPAGGARNVPHNFGFGYDIKSDSGYGISGSTSRHNITIYKKGTDGRIGIQ
jgi:hypothetical protein